MDERRMALVIEARNEARRVMQQVGMDMQSLAAVARQVSSSAGAALTNAFTAAGRTIRGVFNDVVSHAKTAGAALAALAVYGGTKATQAFTEFDSMKRGLVAVMGGANEAKSALAQLIEVSRLPGLELKGAIGLALGLKSAGMDMSGITQTLLSFGNALAQVDGGAVELEGVSRQLVQMIGQGKVLSADIRIMRQYVPQLGAAIKDAFGTTDTEAIQAMGISAEEFLARVNFQLSKLEKVSGGPKVAFETLSQAIWLGLAKIGENIFPLVERITALIDTNADKWADSIANFAGKAAQWILDNGGTLLEWGRVVISVIGNAISWFKENWGTVEMWAGKLYQAFVFVIQGIGAFAAAVTGQLNPGGLTVVQIIGLVIEKVREAAKWWKDHAAAIGQFIAKWGPLILGIIAGLWAFAQLAAVVEGVIVVVSALVGAITALWGPVGIVLLAVGAAALWIWQNWERVSGYLIPLWNQVKQTAIALWHSISDSVRAMWRVVGPILGVALIAALWALVIAFQILASAIVISMRLAEAALAPIVELALAAWDALNGRAVSAARHVARAWSEPARILREMNADLARIWGLGADMPQPTRQRTPAGAEESGRARLSVNGTPLPNAQAQAMPTAPPPVDPGPLNNTRNAFKDMLEYLKQVVDLWRSYTDLVKDYGSDSSYVQAIQGQAQALGQYRDALFAAMGALGDATYDTDEKLKEGQKLWFDYYKAALDASRAIGGLRKDIEDMGTKALESQADAARKYRDYLAEAGANYSTLYNASMPLIQAEQARLSLLQQQLATAEASGRYMDAGKLRGDILEVMSTIRGMQGDNLNNMLSAFKANASQASGWMDYLKEFSGTADFVAGAQSAIAAHSNLISAIQAAMGTVEAGSEKWSDYNSQILDNAKSIQGMMKVLNDLPLQQVDSAIGAMKSYRDLLGEQNLSTRQATADLLLMERDKLQILQQQLAVAQQMGRTQDVDNIRKQVFDLRKEILATAQATKPKWIGLTDIWKNAMDVGAQSRVRMSMAFANGGGGQQQTVKVEQSNDPALKSAIDNLASVIRQWAGDYLG